jgi:L-lactate dehydrogenase complex protein LldE
VHPSSAVDRVQLVATCLGDLVFPDAVRDAVSLLAAGGIAVEVPEEQVCCGQPAFNAGHWRAARRVARTFVRAFSRDLPVVVPSGSCAAMIALRVPDLLDRPPYAVFELATFLDRAQVALDRVSAGVAVAYHTSCHALRELGADGAAERLLVRSGATVVSMRRPDLCCGFGGTFSVRQPEVSVAMADEKLGSAPKADVLVTGDPGCLLHLRARSDRVGGPPVVHLATALAQGVRAAA